MVALRSGRAARIDADALRCGAAALALRSAVLRAYLQLRWHLNQYHRRDEGCVYCAQLCARCPHQQLLISSICLLLLLRGRHPLITCRDYAVAESNTLSANNIILLRLLRLLLLGFCVLYCTRLLVDVQCRKKGAQRRFGFGLQRSINGGAQRVQTGSAIAINASKSSQIDLLSPSPSARILMRLSDAHTALYTRTVRYLFQPQPQPAVLHSV